jgi:hypothetical protein
MQKITVNLMIIQVYKTCLILELKYIFKKTTVYRSNFKKLKEIVEEMML